MNRKAAHRLTERIRKLHKEKVCLSPYADCEGRIVRAHTISEKLMLSPIARDGHVYSWSFEFKPTSGIQDKIRFKLCGLSRTSVFFGFCEKHDRILFSCLETEPFVCSSKQLAMLYFRAISREYNAKLKQYQSIIQPEEFRDIHGPSSEFESELDRYSISVYTAASELHKLKEKIDKIIEHSDYSRIVSHVFEISGGFPVVCAGLTNPDLDFDGNLIQDLSDITLSSEIIALSIVPKGDKAYAVISYLDIHAPAAERLIGSLLKRPDIPADIIWMTFCYFQNSAYSPDWIESLSEEEMEELKRPAFSNINKFDPHSVTLSDRTVEFPGFKLEQTFKI